MKRVGNVINNKLYNPRNVCAAIPIDADEVDGAMERFIRQKYEHRNFQNGNSAAGNGSDTTSPGSRHNTGSTSSDDRPPTLPPKPNKRFFFPSLRSASSIVPRQGTLSPPTSPGYNAYGEPSPPPKDKKHTRFLGASVANTRDDGLEQKIQYLKDMGFSDEKKNAQVLKGLNGNVDKAVETLIRLGEGSNNESTRNQLPTPQATPVNGISVEKTRQPSVPTQTNNPFDRPDTNKSLPPPPSSPTDRSMSPPQAYNPFMQPAQQFSQAPQPSIDQAFSNMSLSQQPTGQPATQLFPNTTGGYGNHGQAAFNPFMQQAAPPMPQVPQQYSQFTPPVSSNPPQQPFPQPQLQPQYNDPAPNPFLRTSRSQNFNPSNPFDTQGPFNAYSTNSPFGIQPQQTGMQTGMQTMSQPQQSNGYNPFQASNPPSQSVFGGPVTSSPAGTPFGQPTGTSMNSYPFGQPVGNSSSFVQQPNTSSPFGPAGPIQQQPGYQQTPPEMQYQAPQVTFIQQPFASPSSAPPQQQSYFQPPTAILPHEQTIPQPQSMQFQQRHDKTSILALYNMPQLAPQNPSLGQGETLVQDFAQQPGMHRQAVTQRSVTMPVSSIHTGAPNPFASLASMAKPSVVQNSSAFGLSGPSRESVDFAGLAMMSGRHSPDAFSGLSARMR
jgi:hypothetical protein